MAEMSELKSQVKELLTKLESSEADFMFAYETANSYQQELEELHAKLSEIQAQDNKIMGMIRDYMKEAGAL